ncbi:uncharacterized protein LOC143635608 [Bidens hawaiensis]|uniref:uncharacterized protein LOC143635608 n=1 Tax=Bidens hawaiensis TaxID=980011 RepID=UPI0040492EC2
MHTTDFTSELPTDAAQTVNTVEATEENFTDDRDYAKFVKLIEDAEKPVYKGCPDSTKLSAPKMLPEGNEMASSTYEVKRTFRAMGVRWKEDDIKKVTYNKIPAKVLWYFPLIPQIKQLFQSPTIARHLRWHTKSRIKDGVLRHPADSPARFTLHAVVLWTINDYPALGTLCGCPYSGFFGCVVCGKERNCVRLRRSNKQSYGGHRRYLPYDHPFRKKNKGFDGTQEFQSEPIPKNGLEIYNEMQYCIKNWGKGHKNNASAMKQVLNGRGGKIKKQREQKNQIQQKKAATVLFFFKSISSKEIELEEVEKLEADLFVTLCLLKKYFAPSFFDVMVHLTVHIARKVKLCGPEKIKFLSEFKKDLKTSIPNSLRNSIENKNRASNKDGVPLSTGKYLDDISSDLFVKAHFYVLQNTSEIVPYINRHMSFLEQQNPDKKTTWLEKEHKKFGMWLRYEVEREFVESRESISETVMWISYGQNRNGLSYEFYDINGFTFRTKSREVKVHQMSGVSVVANDLHISREVKAYTETSYYGVLQDIWVLDYHFRKIPQFKSDRVDNKKGVKKDDIGSMKITDVEEDDMEDDKVLI